MSSPAARLIAFYLPQFHPIPENDAWWGKGFTEWTNVAKARPLFPGHYQPHIPADLGFYDLRVPETRAAQAQMAREHGIEGFCYWHYWFAGKRLLERPFNEVLRSGEPDFPFCLAWANESWTGVWHGAPDRVLQLQTYPGMADHEKHFYTLLEAFQDPRYLTVDGKPLFLVHRASCLPDIEKVTDFWRELALLNGLKGLHLVAVAQAQSAVRREPGFDAVTISNQTILAHGLFGSLPTKLARWLLWQPAIAAIYRAVFSRPVHVYAYEEALRHFVVAGGSDTEYYPCLVPNWDNTPRAGLRGVVLHGSTPQLFRSQVDLALDRVRHLPAERRMIFVKSWNEWAEGNHLEPDQRFGRAYLQVIGERLAVRSEG